MRTRFAPSPTGRLHVGHAYAAYCAFDWARNVGGECVLRIEDIDQTRCRPEYTEGIYEDLTWLGFEWEAPVRVQSEHFPDYTAALNVLIDKGVVYRSFRTRKEINAEIDAAGITESPAGERPYPGPSETLSMDEEQALIEGGQSFAWRLSLDRARETLGSQWDHLGFEEQGEVRDNGWTVARPEWLGDVILARKDTPTSYHLAVCHDDAVQKISHVVRGDDLFFATHIHVVLQALLGFEVPTYLHHRLLLDETGKKFSKSDHSKTLVDMRKDGFSPSDILRLFPL